MMNQNRIFYAVIATLLAASMPTAVLAADVPLNTADASNGLTDIYSATFDPALNPDCTGAANPDACAFFGGQPPATRAITLDPDPTGLDNGDPVGITPQPPSGSFLDLDLGPGNTQVTLNTGVVYIESLVIIISANTANETVVQAFDIGIQFKNFAPLTVPVDGNGVAIFEFDGAPATVADFSTFTDIVDLPADCTGNLCGLIPILTLDMQRFRLILDYDATFGSFTADFQGQTANNSIVSATLNSGVPLIAVTDSVPPANDQNLNFGSVTEMTAANQTVTATNNGTANLVLGTITPPAAPFTLPSDLCSGQTLTPGQNCVIGVRFEPQSTGAFADSLAIPSNDASNPSVTVSLAGTGTAMPVPNITVTDSIPPVDDLDLPYGNVTVSAMRDETVTVTNNGTGDLTLGDVGQIEILVLPFSIPSENCSLATLVPAPAAGSTCTLTVRFEPTAAGPSSDSFDIPSNDPDEPSVVVTVSGTGAADATPSITVTDSVDPADDLQVPFGDIWEAFTVDQIITLTNDGDADLTIGTITAPAAPFAIVNDPCSGRTLMPTMSCAVDISFTATSISTFNGMIDIPSNDPDTATVTVNLSGTGVPPDVGERLSTEPSGADGGFFGSALAPQTLLTLLLLPALRSRRRRGARG